MSKFQDIRWFIYARKSEDDRDKQVQSIEGQLEDLQSVLARIGGGTVVDCITEEESAKEPGRPKFNRMIGRLKRGDANGILVWAYNRLVRNPVDDGTVKWLLQRGVIQCIKTVDRDFWPNDNALLLSIEGGTANQYILDLQKNVKRGLEQKLKKGWKPGQAPLGYLNTKTEATGDNYIVRDPHRFNMIEKAWRLMLSGQYTPPQILSIMNSDWGFRTRKTKRQGGKPLSRSGIYNLFTDVFYTGLFMYNKSLYQGKHPPMITTDEFDVVQRLLGRDGRPRPQKHKFKYTGIMHCGDCGSAITATEKKKFVKRDKSVLTYVYYHCTKHKKSATPCSQKEYVTEPELETMISDEVASLTISTQFKDWAFAILDTIFAKDIAAEEVVIAQLRATLQTTQTELSNLTTIRIRGLIDDVEFSERKKELQDSVAMLKQKVSEAGQYTTRKNMEIKKAFSFAHIAKEKFIKGSDEDKKEVLLALGWNHLIIGKKLYLSRDNRYEAIIKSRDAVEAEISRLEPNITVENKGFEGDMTLVCPLLLALVNEVRTITSNNPHTNTDDSNTTRAP